MKKRVFILIVISIIMVSNISLAAYNLSGLSFDELLELREDTYKEICKRSEWKEVIVPSGYYRIGVDIPAGHWTIKATGNVFATIQYFKETDATGKNPLNYGLTNYFYESLAGPESDYASTFVNQVDIDMKNGWYFNVTSGSVIFVPYIGNPALGF